MRKLLLSILLLMIGTSSWAVFVYDVTSNTPLAIDSSGYIGIGNEATVDLSEDAPKYTYNKDITTYTTTDTTWQTHTVTANAVEISIYTENDAYIGYDTTADAKIMKIPGSLEWWNKPLPLSITTINFKHITTSDDITIEERIRQ